MLANNVPNQKGLKSRKFHMRSILIEVKNKTLIDEIQNQRQLNGSMIHKAKKVSKIEKEDDVLEQQQAGKLYQINQQQTEESEQNSQRVLEEKDTNTIMVNLNPTLLKKAKEQTRRRSSRMEMQLQEIIKYSKLYPSRNNSERILQENIKKLLDPKVEVSPQKQAKSKFSAMNQPPHSVQRQNRIRKKRITVGSNKPKENILLNLVDYNLINLHEDNKEKKIKFLLKKSKKMCCNNTNMVDFSLESFIQNQLNSVRLKQGRKTVGYFNRGRDRNEKLDVRDEKILDLHMFLRGEPKQDSDISNYVNSRQIQKFRTKYDIYNNIYKKTKYGTNNQKFNIYQMKELTLRNAVYLNEIRQQPNGREKRSQIEKEMKRIHFFY